VDAYCNPEFSLELCSVGKRDSYAQNAYWDLEFWLNSRRDAEFSPELCSEKNRSKQNSGWRLEFCLNSRGKSEFSPELCSIGRHKRWRSTEFSCEPRILVRTLLDRIERSHVRTECLLETEFSAELCFIITTHIRRIHCRVSLVSSFESEFLNSAC
jgi:hypothetical protein